MTKTKSLPVKSNSEQPSASTPSLHELTEHAEAIRALYKRAAADIIEIGRRLVEAKALCGHGHWLPWLEKEFGWAEQTARNFMQVYERSKSTNFGDLDLPVSAMYLLSAPSTPETAGEAVVERAKTGEKVTGAEVKKIIHEARTQQSSPRPPGTKKIEIKRHDERMKSARYKLEAFIRDYSWPNGRKLSRQSKHSLERNMSDSLFHPSAGIWPLKSRTSGPFEDLIASMLTFGWIEEMPAILCEYGVVIDGNDA